jgi:hypothetical protein
MNRLNLYLVVGVIAFVVFIYLAISFDISYTDPEVECTKDSDCVPDSCCHSDSCVQSTLKPDCSGVACTLMCSGPLDCGAGSCSCVDGKCGVLSVE